jgi:dienelactone hydrolase
MGDAKAKESIDRNIFLFALHQRSARVRERSEVCFRCRTSEFRGYLAGLAPLMLKGYLRRPAGAGPFPAVVLLPGCNGTAEPLDQNWGVRLVEWGYLTLTVDSVSPRGLKNICGGGARSDMQFDAHRALDFPAGKEFVNAKRAAVLGFSYGGFLSLSAIENGQVERAAENKFAAAIAFYPPCQFIKGPMTTPSLILIGEKDDWTPVDACRKLASGQDDLGLSRPNVPGVPLKFVVLADAYHAYDVPWLQTPVNYFGHHLVYNETATHQSSEALREFLAVNLPER